MPRILPRVGILIALLITAIPREALAQSREIPKRTCWRGRPQPVCDVFWITELGFYPRLASTRSGPIPAIETHGSAEIGRMVNNGGSAHGFLVSMGTNERFALLYRHRRWVGTEGTFDLTAGPLQTAIHQPVHSYLEDRAFGLTGEIALGWRDYGQISIRGDLARAEGVTASALFGGVRLGSRPAVVTAATGALLFGIFAALVMTSFEGDF